MDNFINPMKISDLRIYSNASKYIINKLANLPKDQYCYIGANQITDIAPSILSEFKVNNVGTNALTDTTITYHPVSKSSVSGGGGTTTVTTTTITDPVESSNITVKELISDPEVISGNLVLHLDFENSLNPVVGSITFTGSSYTYELNDPNDPGGETIKLNTERLVSDYTFDLKTYWSISLWWKPNNFANGRVIFGVGDTVFTHHAVLNCFYLNYNGNGAWTLTPENSLIPDVNKFYHIVFTFNAGLWQIYLDGQALSTPQTGGTFPTPNWNGYFILGGATQQYSVNDRSNANYDDIKIYDKALSAIEISNLYNYHSLVIPYSLYTDTTQSLQSLAEFKTGVNGWRIVANLKSESSRTMNWYSDGFLNGNITSGDPNDFTNDWEKPFTNKDQILFVFGNLERWAYCSYTDLIALSGNTTWHQLDATTSQYKADGSSVSKIAVLTEFGGSHSPFILLGKSYDATDTTGVDFNGGEEWLYLEKGSVVNSVWNKWLNTPYYIFVRSSTDTETVNPPPEYKTLTFTYETVEDLVYDFTDKNSLTDWNNYATSIGATTTVNEFQLGGVYGYPGNGYIEYPLPSGYDTVEVHFGNPYGGETVVYIDGVEKLKCNVNENKIHTQTYTPGQILKVQENGGIIHPDLKIILKKNMFGY